MMVLTKSALASVALLTLMGLSGPAGAGIIYVTSNAGDDVSEDTGYTGTFTPVGGGAVAVNPHPAWQQPAAVNPNLGAEWISYADTGYQGAVFAPFKDTCDEGAGGTAGCDPLMIVTEQFILDGTGTLNLQAWADDTIDIYVNGVLEIPANLSQGTCAAGSPGCEPNEFALLNLQLAAGVNTIEFHVYQVGEGGDTTSNPFGLLYSGTIAVPEPVTLSLLGAGLLGLGFAARRRRS